MTRLRSLDDLLAVVPYLFGYHPSDCLVVLGARADRIVFQLRSDLPPPADAARLAAHHADVVVRQRATTAILIGYGSGRSVTPAVHALRAALASRGVDVLDALRVAHGRYWSYLCTEPRCCPPEGRRFAAATHPLAVEAVVAGREALPSRQALAARFAPVDGPARVAMTAATDRARARASRDRAGAVCGAGAAAVDAALARHRAGAALTDDEVAWLSVVLRHRPVRDHAWRRLDADLDDQIALWTDLVRRVDPELAAPPATLLAFAAWRAGEGTVASVALDRALATDPTYPMAQLLREALDAGLSPVDWVGTHTDR